MRASRLAAVTVALLAAGPTPAARAEPVTTVQVDAYKQRMTAGARLLEEENPAGARAEFEAAYAALPKAGALIQVAACEKALHRHPQAIAALERALRDHGAGMDEGERRAALEGLAELRAALGFVEVRLSPPGATLRIDGEDQAAGAAERRVALGPGSHRLEARLAGHAPAAQTVTLTSGETARVTLALSTEQAEVTVRPPSDAGPSARGAYLLGGFVVFVPLAPTDFSGTAPGLAVSARGGYRLASVVGLEAGVEYARYALTGVGNPSYADVSAPLGFTHHSVRAGLHLRLMTTGERVRFVQTLGGGVMGDFVSWQPDPAGPPRQDARGANGFGVAETGIELDIRGALVAVMMQNFLGSSGGLTSEKHDAYAAETYGGPQYAIGFGVRGGYRFW